MPDQPAIAIVGIGCVFPEAPDPASLWRVVAEARDTSREVPPERWIVPADSVHHPGAPSPDRVVSRRGCYAEIPPLPSEGLEIDPGLVAELDLLVQLTLVAGEQAFRESITSKVDRDRIGVILGNIALPTDHSSRLAVELLGGELYQRIVGGVASVPSVHPRNRYVTGLPAGLLATALGLGGGSYTLDAACASSLYAIDLAARELQSGRADAMLSGGVSRPSCLYTQMGFSQLRALSPSGHCSPFDRKGDGIVVGEGAGILVLKRLDDALRHGDRIYAVLRGAGLSNDVQGKLLSPSSEGQLRAMRKAYDESGWTPEQVDLVECHATGTPVGDRIEFESLRALWPEGARTVIGSVKSNVGHALTAAGAAGVMKVLLAFESETLPPTANFEAPPEDLAIEGSPFEVLSQAEPWPQREQHPRRAAVSGFGFGGINAHLLFEAWDDSAPPSISPTTLPRAAAPQPPVAVVGMAARFGPWCDLRSFAKRVLGADPREPAPRRGSWGLPALESVHGYFLDEIAVSPGELRIPPRELLEMLPQQLLMLLVAKAALENAAIEPLDRLDTGTFIGIGLDLESTNYHLRWWARRQAPAWAQELGLDPAEFEGVERWLAAVIDAAGPPLSADRTMGNLGGIVASRVARELRIGGPSFVLSDEEASGLAAFDAAVRALQRGTVQTALVGAVDLAGDPRAVAAAAAERPLAGDRGSRPFDRDADGWWPGEGAAAVVLKRLGDARRDGDRIYAVVRGLGVAGGAGSPVPTERVVRTSISRAIREADVEPASIAYVESYGSGVSVEDQVETDSLRAVLWAEPGSALSRLGSVKADIGHTGAASALASVIKSCLALDRAVLAPLRGLEMPRSTLDGDECRLELSSRPCYWLNDRDSGPRRALVGSLSVAGTSRHLVLEEGPGGAGEAAPALGAHPAAIFAVEAASPEELELALAELGQLAGQAEPIESLARSWWQKRGSRPDAPFALALVAASPTELRDRVRKARSTEPSERTSRALAGELAFVFPGSGSHFRDMGRELALSFPQVMRAQESHTTSLRSQLVPEVFWSDREPDDPRELLLAPVALACFMADLLRSHGVQPDAGLGYSLGETASLFALGAWKDRDEMLRRVQEGDLFSHQLAGPCQAARQSWEVAEGEPFEWQAGVIELPAERLRRALADEERLELLIVNTPDQCVIGGDRARLEALVQRLEAPFHPLQGVLAVHGPMASPAADAYRRAHLLATTAPDGLRFYSAAWAASYEPTEQSTADSIGAQATSPLDFDRLVEKAWQDGVRTFLEVGPGSACTRMIRSILGDRPHLALAACPAGAPPLEAYLRTLAALVEAGVPVDLGALYPDLPEEPPGAGESSAERILLPVGRGPFEAPARPEPRRPEITTPELVLAPPDPEPPPPRVSSPPPGELVRQMASTDVARTEAHQTFLRVSQQISASLSLQLEHHMQLLERLGGFPPSPSRTATVAPAPSPSVAFPRERCLEFAIGSIAAVLGPDYAAVDSHPTRVRLPDEPLMLVDRIVEVEGEPLSLGPGRVVTEHDVLPGDWYLDAGRIPTAIAVESGQADLFLSAYLGIDFETRGEAVYRLLDAAVTFHRPLPGPGAVIVYDIRIDRFFRHEGTWFFHFHFDATVNGELFLTMKNGSAGFFTQEALDAGQGIVHSRLDREPIAGRRPDDWRPLVELARESYDESQVEALRRGDFASIFGETFRGLAIEDPLPLPGGRLHLVDRVVALEPEGGRYGLGLIRAEADIHPDDWFLTCHFVDDRVMPGTLMYECCLHTLRILLTRMGWVAERGDAAWEPVPGIEGRLKCRGQVIDTTRVATYEVSLKEIGFGPEPYAIADALMFADGKAIVEMRDMSIRLSGSSREQLEQLWSKRESLSRHPPVEKPVLYEHDRILAFAIGKPSEAFGEPYRIFDQDRVIARLPGPPFQFLDRIVGVTGKPFELVSGIGCEAEVDVTPDAWYFEQNRQDRLPFAVLLEMALQPCGWLAAYAGSALQSEEDVSFRNLGGRAVLHRPLGRDAGTLTTEVTMKDVSISGGMIIQHYRFRMLQGGDPVYEGTTYFGFFSKAALADQKGIRDAEPYRPSEEELAAGRSLAYPAEAPFPDTMMQMVSRIDHLSPTGGAHGQGLVLGSVSVDPAAWFFKAHFHQDPVWPGSLGLESFLQLLELAATERWGTSPETTFVTPTPGLHQEWVYRGQILPSDGKVQVQASIEKVDDESRQLVGEGWLEVDGRVIYRMKSFGVALED